MFIIDTPILAYHQITSKTPAKNLNYAVSVSQFKRQMHYLHENKYVCLSLTEVLQNLHKNRSPRRRTVAITFDDGFKDFFTLAYPILRDYGYMATVFVITNTTHEQNDLAREVDNGYLTWGQIETLRQNGISFGSHTCSHYRLPSLSREAIWRELAASKECLETRLRQEIEWLAYPYSVSTDEIRRMAEVAGYKAAFGVNVGKSDRFNIWRRLCYRDETLMTFAIRLNRWFYYQGFFREHTGIMPFLRKIKHRFDYGERS